MSDGLLPEHIGGDSWRLTTPMPWWKKGKAYLCWRILRGQPVIYGVRIIAPLRLTGAQDVRIADCHFDYNPDLPWAGAVEITP